MAAPSIGDPRLAEARSAHRTPQFIVVGAPKCGTTALHSYLVRQPGVFVPELKEPHYFAPDVPIRRRLTESQYLELFASASATDLRGEVSVWYLYSEVAAEQIHRLCGNVRIVAMLRNPVEAMPALHGQFVLNGDENVRDFPQALALETERLQGLGRPPGSWVGARCLCYREVYRYAEQVERFVQRFGREQVHIMLFDDFARDTRASYRHLLDFLGVPWDGEQELRPVLRHRRLRWLWLKRLERRLEQPLRRLARRWLPQAAGRRRLGRRWLKRLRRFNSYQAARPPLPRELAARLRHEAAPDIRRLEQIIGRTTGWLEGCGISETDRADLT